MAQNTLKVALITGSARRLGAEIARILHENNINVVLHYHRSKEFAERLCEELNQIRPDSAALVSANLAHSENLKPLIETAVGVWGRLDILINNASQFYATKMTTITDANWDDLMNTNLKAPLFLSQAAAVHLSQNNGCIVNLTDIHAEKPMRDYSVYCVSKAGLVMLTQSLAQELGPAIRVNAVSPGPIGWPENSNELSDTKKAALISRTALKHEGKASDIAQAVLYFVCYADYVTGQVLAVDAGRSLYM